MPTKVPGRIVPWKTDANAGPFSVSRLHGTLVSQGVKVGKPTLLSYLDHLCDAYLVFLISIRSRSAKQKIPSTKPRLLKRPPKKQQKRLDLVLAPGLDLGSSRDLY